MGRPKRWNSRLIKPGFIEVKLSSWKYFPSYIETLLDFNALIWRGQQHDEWKLEPSIDRIFKKRAKSLSGIDRNQHLINFKYATRGRRGNNLSEISENDWWALGQHQGLATPLLDWTTSPYVAAYFAFSENNVFVPERRAIWALYRPTIEEASETIKSNYNGEGRPPIIEIVSPLSDGNSRLVNQSGLFTRAPDNIDIETWVSDNFSKARGWVLNKITVPNSERENVLRSLNRMNINHLTLFPDLYGASKYCNLDLVIKKY